MLFVRDIPYRRLPNEKLYFDLYQPDIDEEVPVIAFFHGGGYIKGSRKDVDMRLVRPLVENGYAVASVEYRLAPTVTIDAMFDDCHYSIQWMIASLDGCGLDLGLIGAWGISAGGRLAALLGAMGEVDAVFDSFGSSNFSLLDKALEEEKHVAMFGTKSPSKELIAAYDPISYITKNSAPFLFVHGAKDMLIPSEQNERLHRALQGKRIDSQMLLMEEAGHEIPDSYIPIISNAMLRFFRKHLG